MPRPSRTEFALLGLLANRPRSGYDLKKAIEAQISHFWSESYGQIYPLLNRMEKEGLTTCTRVVEEGKPLRKVYNITEQGVEKFEKWLEAPFEESPPRNELLLKVFFGKRLRRERLKEHLRLYQSQILERIIRFERVQKETQKPSGGNLDIRFWGLTLSYRISEAKARLRWVEESLRLLDEEL